MYSKILEEHLERCEKEEKFVEASAARDRIKEFKKIEEEKLRQKALKEYENQRQTLEQELEESLNEIIKKKEDELKLLTESFDQQQAELLERQEKELKEFKEECDNKLNDSKLDSSKLNESLHDKTLKPSAELLNWMKIKDTAIKQKNYERAQEASNKIEELAEREIAKHNQQNQKKFQAELKKILKKQDNEKNAFEQKKKSVLTTFNKSRDEELDSLKKRYKGKLTELENWQKLEASNFNKIKKGLSRPSSRIQSILRSASSLKSMMNSKTQS